MVNPMVFYNMRERVGASGFDLPFVDPSFAQGACLAQVWRGIGALSGGLLLCWLCLFLGVIIVVAYSGFRIFTFSCEGGGSGVVGVQCSVLYRCFGTFFNGGRIRESGFPGYFCHLAYFHGQMGRPRLREHGCFSAYDPDLNRGLND